MTREHKLALIVGFSLVLVLGVLLSDHFSKARSMDPAIAAAQPGQAGQFGANNALVAVTPPTALPPTEVNRVSPQGLPSGAGKADVVTQMQPLSPPSHTPGRESVEIVTAVPRGEVGRNGGVSTPLVGIDESPIPSGPAGSLPVSRQPLRRHDVKEGDSIYRIASSVYGDGNLWTKIRDYPGNKNKIGDNGAMRDGVTLLLPPLDVLQGKAVLADERVGAAPTGASPTPQPPQGQDAATRDDSKNAVKTATYTVKSGDTLASIARRKLGSVAKTQDIIDLNRSQLSDPDDLKIGMVLKLPVR